MELAGVGNDSRKKLVRKLLKAIDTCGIIVYNYAKAIERTGEIHERRYLYETSGDHE